MSDMPTYIIIIVLVMLKIFIWVCIFRYRSQRRQAVTRCQRGIIVIQTDTSLHPDAVRDRDMIIPHENILPYSGGIDNPQVVLQNPPAYDDVIQEGGRDCKPPSYEQVIGASQTTAVQDGSQNLS